MFQTPFRTNNMMDRMFRTFRAPRRKVYSGSGINVGELIEVCPGGRHAWFKTDNLTSGRVRKPFPGFSSEATPAAGDDA